MEKALQVLNQMHKEQMFERYAIGGGIAAIFYIEPFTTFDLDVFIILKQEKPLVSLSPIYEWLKEKGYKYEREQIIIEGIPVQFIPAYNELVKESILKAEKKIYGETQILVISKEYLFTIMMQTNRPKDRERMTKFLDQAELSQESLMKILKKFNLIDEFLKIRES